MASRRYGREMEACSRPRIQFCVVVVLLAFNIIYYDVIGNKIEGK
jgi:hypothetical protein